MKSLRYPLFCTGLRNRMCQIRASDASILKHTLIVSLHSWDVNCIELTMSIHVSLPSYFTVFLRSNPSVCPRRRRRHVRTSKNTAFCGTKCTCPWSWLSCCNAQLSYLCVECYNNNIINIMNNIIIIIIKPLLKTFNECRSLTGVGKLNPYCRPSMNVEVWRGWEN